MPLNRILRNLVCCARREQEEAEPDVMRPELLPVEAGPVEPGRPHRAFVEREARRYWQEVVNVGGLTKPSREDIRAAAMPVLCQALRNRPGSRRHQAVAAVVQHALERGWIKPPFSEACESPSYIDALIELAKDARWILPVEEMRDVLKLTIQWKLLCSTILPQEKSEVLQAVMAGTGIDRLCELYDLLTRKEWQAGGARRRQGALATRTETIPSDAASPRFELENKRNLDSEAVEKEIRRCLRAYCHPFISQAVYYMEFGYSEAVRDFPGLMHASDGIRGVGNCSIFYYANEDYQLIRIVGIGYLERNTFRLEYAAGELENCRGKLHIPHELEYGIWPS